MSWICEYCSTVNDEDCIQCFVCEKERSKESIEAANQIKREERIRRINTTIYTSTSILGRILCISSIVLFSIVALVALIFKMKNGAIGDIVSSSISIIENVGKNFKLLFGVNFDLIASHLKNSPMQCIGDNFETISNYAKNTLHTNCECIVTELFINRAERYEILAQKNNTIKDSVHGAFDIYGSVISNLLDNIGDRFEDIADNIKEIIQKTKESILNVR